MCFVYTVYVVHLYLEISITPVFCKFKYFQNVRHYVINSLQSAFVVSLANIQVPVLLGEVVNVVAKFTREMSTERRIFSQEVAGPVVKLVKYYCIQVRLKPICRKLREINHTFIFNVILKG